MRVRKIARTLLLTLAVACNSGSSGAQWTASAAPAIDAGPIVPGVSARFAQGWPDRHWPLLEAIPASLVRDNVAWRMIETAPGQYVFNENNSGHVQRLCQLNRKVILVLLPRNPAYDGGLTVYTPEARAAFARYVAALAAQFGECLLGLEIGNEINGAGNLTGVAATDRPRYYTALLKDVYQAVKPSFPGLQILGGSTNAIGTGFLDDLFAAGALEFMDGVVVHPYRQDAANVDWELGRLQAAMAAGGMVKPIWATEFGWEDPDAGNAAFHLAKMLTLMNAVGVEHAVWFDLVDDKLFPNFGLFRSDGAAKPAARTFTYFAAQVLPRGRAMRVDGPGSGLFRYRFGSDRQVVWGARRPVASSGPLVFRNVEGAVIAPPDLVSEVPFVAEGTGTLSFGPPTVLADSLYDFGRAPWTYLGHRGDDPDRVLGPIDWRFTTFIGDSTLKPAAINQLGVLPAGTGNRAVTFTLRYSADEAMRIYASGCLAPRNAASNGARFELRHNGSSIHSALVGDSTVQFAIPVWVQPGQSVDFVFGPPNATLKADTIKYRVRVSRSLADPAPC